MAGLQCGQIVQLTLERRVDLAQVPALCNWHLGQWAVVVWTCNLFKLTDLFASCSSIFPDTSQIERPADMVSPLPMREDSDSAPASPGSEPDRLYPCMADWTLGCRV